MMAVIKEVYFCWSFIAFGWMTAVLFDRGFVCDDKNRGNVVRDSRDLYKICGRWIHHARPGLYGRRNGCK